MLLKRSGLLLKKPSVNKWASHQMYDFGASFFAILFSKSIVDNFAILQATAPSLRQGRRNEFLPGL